MVFASGEISQLFSRPIWDALSQRGRVGVWVSWENNTVSPFHSPIISVYPREIPWENKGRSVRRREWSIHRSTSPKMFDSHPYQGRCPTYRMHTNFLICSHLKEALLLRSLHLLGSAMFEWKQKYLYAKKVFPDFYKPWSCNLFRYPQYPFI